MHVSAGRAWGKWNGTLALKTFRPICRISLTPIFQFLTIRQIWEKLAPEIWGNKGPYIIIWMNHSCDKCKDLFARIWGFLLVGNPHTKSAVVPRLLKIFDSFAVSTCIGCIQLTDFSKFSFIGFLKCSRAFKYLWFVLGLYFFIKPDPFRYLLPKHSL